MYSRAASADPNVMATYATIPTRAAAHGGAVLRSSSSQDHLAGQQPRPAYQVAYAGAAMPVQPLAPPFPLPPTPGTHADLRPNGLHHRPSRPLAVYQPWTSAAQQPPPFVQGLEVVSPPSSGSSSDSGTQATSFRSPSSSPSNTVFYGYGPTRQAGVAQPALSAGGGRCVRALYSCVGENPAELSFEPNAIIMNGKMHEAD